MDNVRYLYMMLRVFPSVGRSTSAAVSGRVVAIAP